MANHLGPDSPFMPDNAKTEDYSGNYVLPYVLNPLDFLNCAVKLIESRPVRNYISSTQEVRCGLSNSYSCITMENVFSNFYKGQIKYA